MADMFAANARKTLADANREPDTGMKQTLMDRYKRLCAAEQAWGERYSVSTGYAYRAG